MKILLHILEELLISYDQWVKKQIQAENNSIKLGGTDLVGSVHQGII